jgi:hypothetical protein
MNARRISLALVLVALNIAPFGTAQFAVPEEAIIVSVDSVHVRVAGGVIVVTAMTTLAEAGCTLTDGNVWQFGTNLFLTLVPAKDPACQVWPWPCPECEVNLPLQYQTNVNSNVIVLPLSPGRYSFATSYWHPLDIGGIHLPQYETFPPGATNFEVAAKTEPVVTIHPEPSQVRLEVAGGPLARYELESSSDLKQWTTLRSQIGAPFTYRAPLFTSLPSGFTGSRAEFYRVKASGTKTPDVPAHLNP